MAYGTEPTDLNSIPISTVYVPGVSNFPALRGSPLTFTDTSNNVSSGVLTNMIFEAVLNGQLFSATTGAVSNSGSNAVAGFSVFNGASTGKSILIYALSFTDNQPGNSACHLNAVTTNPALATVLTPANRTRGSASASVASVTFLNTGYSPSGTAVDLFSTETANTAYQLLSSEAPIVLQKGSAQGIVFAPTMVYAATHTFVITATWIEF